MPWTNNGTAWACEICNQTTDNARAGPWCALYCDANTDVCLPVLHDRMKAADSRGDGPFVNAACWAGRARWGVDWIW